MTRSGYQVIGFFVKCTALVLWEPLSYPSKVGIVTEISLIKSNQIVNWNKLGLCGSELNRFAKSVAIPSPIFNISESLQHKLKTLVWFPWFPNETKIQCATMLDLAGHLLHCFIAKSTRGDCSFSTIPDKACRVCGFGEGRQKSVYVVLISRNTRANCNAKMN